MLVKLNSEEIYHLIDIISLYEHYFSSKIDKYGTKKERKYNKKLKKKLQKHLL